MGEREFYMWHIEKTNGKTKLYVVLLIIGAILVILYPAWPYPVKLGIFYILFYFLIAMFIIILVRLVLYLFLYIFGFSLWIFPNLFADDKNPI